MMSLRAAGSTVWLGLVSVSWVGSWRFTVSVYCWGRPKFTIRSSSLRRIALGRRPCPITVHLIVWSTICAFRLDDCFDCTSESLRLGRLTRETRMLLCV